jgi:hypothetical protein
MGDKNVLKISFINTDKDKSYDVKTELYMKDSVKARVLAEDIVTYS